MTNRLTAAINSHRKKVDSQIDKARAQVERLLSQTLLPNEQDKVYGLLKDFATTYFIHGIAEQYPLISEDIFQERVRTELTAKDRYGSPHEYVTKVPVVLKLDFDQKGKDVFDMHVKGKRIDVRSEEEDLSIRCSVPEIVPEARAALLESMGFNARLIAQAYRDPLVSRILMRDKISTREIPEPTDSQYSLVWAPSTWDARVVEKDPAIFMKYLGRNFLVYQWDIPEEKSLDVMLREFREELPE